MLRSCAAYEAYLRTYRRGVVGRRAVEFLLLDRLFPRSVFHALSAAESVLYDLDPGPARRGTESEARRLVGRACAELEFVRADELEAIAARATRPARAGGQRGARRDRRTLLPRVDRDPVERLMTWRLSVEHVTTLRVRSATCSRRTTRRGSRPRRDRQLVLDHRVHGATRAFAVMRYVDYWGSEVCAFDVTEPHQTARRHRPVAGRDRAEPALADRR